MGLFHFFSKWTTHSLKPMGLHSHLFQVVMELYLFLDMILWHIFLNIYCHLLPKILHLLFPCFLYFQIYLINIYDFFFPWGINLIKIYKFSLLIVSCFFYIFFYSIYRQIIFITFCHFYFLMFSSFFTI